MKTPFRTVAVVSSNGSKTDTTQQASTDKKASKSVFSDVLQFPFKTEWRRRRKKTLDKTTAFDPGYPTTVNRIVSRERVRRFGSESIL